MELGELTLYSREAALARPSPVPQQAGVYAWFFKGLPNTVPTEGCTKRSGYTLLYVGMASNLRRRVKNHFAGDASRSTLRQTLGTLLGMPLVRGADERLTFGVIGEDKLDEWMADNAVVGWWQSHAPQEQETRLIAELRPPLNLRHNGHPFSEVVGRLRQKAQGTTTRALRSKVGQVTVPVDVQSLFDGDVDSARMHPEVALDHADIPGQLLAICYKGFEHGCIKWRVYYSAEKQSTKARRQHSP
jgi:hypothetical protein